MTEQGFFTEFVAFVRKTFPGDGVVPLHAPRFTSKERELVLDTLDSTFVSSVGEYVDEFETRIANFTGAKFAVATNNGTAEMHIALILADVGLGDEVITQPLTFVATCNAMRYCGADPVFVDVEPGTLTMDVKQIEERITSRTKAIVPVHFAGHPCDMDPIMDLAKKYKLVVVEDAAHALESKYKGRKIGNLGNSTAFSFYANKNITTGEGGMLTTNDESLDETIRVLRLQGLSRDAWKRYGKSGFAHWELQLPGFKYNMADINAALGIHQLKKAPRFLKIRKQYASIYDKAFCQIPELEILETRDYADPSYHLYIIALRLEQLSITRDAFIEAIQAAGVGVAVHYHALHLQPFYKKEFCSKLEMYPVATNYSNRVLSLPLYPRMSVQDVEHVIDMVADLVSSNRR